MKKDHFKSQWQQHFDRYEVPVDPEALWQELEPRLPQKKKRLSWLLILSAILVIGGGILWFIKSPTTFGLSKDRRYPNIQRRSNPDQVGIEFSDRSQFQHSPSQMPPKRKQPTASTPSENRAKIDDRQNDSTSLRSTTEKTQHTHSGSVAQHHIPARSQKNHIARNVLVALPVRNQYASHNHSISLTDRTPIQIESKDIVNQSRFFWGLNAGITKPGWSPFKLRPGQMDMESLLDLQMGYRVKIQAGGRWKRWSLVASVIYQQWLEKFEIHNDLRIHDQIYNDQAFVFQGRFIGATQTGIHQLHQDVLNYNRWSILQFSPTLSYEPFQSPVLRLEAGPLIRLTQKYQGYTVDSHMRVQGIDGQFAARTLSGAGYQLSIQTKLFGHAAFPVNLALGYERWPRQHFNQFGPIAIHSWGLDIGVVF